MGWRDDYNRDQIVDALVDIDASAVADKLLDGDGAPRGDGDLSRVVIVGGSALILLGLTTRTVTHDIDIVDASPDVAWAIDESPLANRASATYADCLPYNFEDRLVDLDVPSRAVRFMVPSLEDLAVMKLYGMRGNDEIDLNSPAFIERLDWGLLDYLVYDDSEAKASCLADCNYRTMVMRYEEYKHAHFCIGAHEGAASLQPPPARDARVARGLGARLGRR